MEFLEGNMCRLCLGKKDLLDLFIPESSDSLCSMLTACTTIKLSRNDGFPPYICVTCTQHLELSYHFIQQSQKSDRILQTDYIQNSYGKLEPYEMPTDLEYEDVLASCEVKLDYEDASTDSKDDKHIIIDSENRIIFERAADLRRRIGDFLPLSQSAANKTRNRGGGRTANTKPNKDVVRKTVERLKTNANLTVKKVHTGHGRINNNSKSSRVIKRDLLSSDDENDDDGENSDEDEGQDRTKDSDPDSDFELPLAQTQNDLITDEDDYEDADYVPKVKIVKTARKSNTKSKQQMLQQQRMKNGGKLNGGGNGMKMKIRRRLIPSENRPKYEKMTRNSESRFKITPKIIQLSKYKNCTSSGGKGQFKGLNERMIKVYRPKHPMRDGGPGKRGRKPVLDRDESGRIIRPKHQCYVCGLMTADIKQHMTSHTGEKSHVCEVCQRRFSTRGNLIHHKKIHSGVKSHVCQVCGAAFIYASCLQRHLDIHTGTKPHACHLCDKRFQLAQGLKRHLTVHEGARPHACHMCPARFNQPHQLKTHIRSHTGEKPYVCSECGEAFTYKYVLNNHVKKHAAAAATGAASGGGGGVVGVVVQQNGGGQHGGGMSVGVGGQNIALSGGTSLLNVSGLLNVGIAMPPHHHLQLQHHGQQQQQLTLGASGLTALHSVQHMMPELIQQNGGGLVQHVVTNTSAGNTNAGGAGNTNQNGGGGGLVVNMPVCTQ